MTKTKHKNKSKPVTNREGTNDAKVNFEQYKTMTTETSSKTLRPQSLRSEIGSKSAHHARDQRPFSNEPCDEVTAHARYRDEGVRFGPMFGEWTSFSASPLPAQYNRRQAGSMTLRDQYTSSVTRYSGSDSFNSNKSRQRANHEGANHEGAFQDSTSGSMKQTPYATGLYKQAPPAHEVPIPLFPSDSLIESESKILKRV